MLEERRLSVRRSELYKGILESSFDYSELEKKPYFCF